MTRKTEADMEGRPLRDLSAQALTHVVEANLFALTGLLGLFPGLEVHDEPNMLWSISDIPFPLFNGVLRARLTEETADAAIETTVARYRARNVPCLWKTGPQTRPADLGARLAAAGFARDEVPGMALRLDDLPEQWPANANLAVAAVRDDATAAEFCAAMVAGFGIPPFLGPIFLDFMTRYGYDARQPYQNYAASLAGRIVGVMSVLAGAGVAGIYNVAVLPEARRQGVAGGLLLAVLRDLPAAGFRAAILHSTPMGYNLYRRLGFEEYCTIGRYLWRPPAA